MSGLVTVRCMVSLKGHFPLFIATYKSWKTFPKNCLPKELFQNRFCMIFFFSFFTISFFFIHAIHFFVLAITDGEPIVRILCETVTIWEITIRKSESLKSSFIIVSSSRNVKQWSSLSSVRILLTDSPVTNLGQPVCDSSCTSHRLSWNSRHHFLTICTHMASLEFQLHSYFSLLKTLYHCTGYTCGQVCDG